MRILNLDSTLLVSGFQALGHSVLSAGYGAQCDMHFDRPKDARHVYARLCKTGFTPDMVFYCDSGNLPYFPHVEELPCPTVFYTIDTYCNYWHFAYAHAFDAVFLAQKEHVPFMLREGLPSYWLPLFAHAAKDICRDEERDIPVSFVGNIGHRNNPDRKPFLENFRKAHPLAMPNAPYVDVFNRSRIVLNQTASSELNQRCFEAMACGAALLTEHSLHGLTELFIPGETILEPYQRNNWQQAAAIARKALETPEALMELARRGQELVARKHTDRNRAQSVLAIMERMIADQAQAKRLGEQERRRLLVSRAYAMIGNDLEEGVMDNYSRHFFELTVKFQGPSHAA